MRKGKHPMNNPSVRKKRRNWRPRTYIWILIAVTVVAALLYWEQAALLYLISTVWTCGLLLRVAFSDLETRDRELSEPLASTEGFRPDSAKGAKYGSQRQAPSSARRVAPGQEAL